MKDQYITKVAEFHEAFSYRFPHPVEPDLSSELLSFRMDLMAEESNEMMNAYRTNDRVEMLDGLCDMEYILSGSILACGVVDRFEKFELLESGSTEMEYQYHTNLIIDTMHQIRSTTDPDVLAASFYDLRDSRRELTHMFGFDAVFDGAFGAVADNNMDKFWSKDQVSAYGVLVASKVSIKDGVDSFEETSRGIIARRYDGKVIKPPGFKPVDLSPFLQ